MIDDPVQLLWLAAGAFAALAVLAAWADYRRARRRDVDKPGWVPWELVLIFAMIAAVVCGALALMV